jgi:pantoate--beta-alanine ligase
MRSHADSLRREGRTIGFVPTMGFLHEGHLSLVRRARQECGAVVVSIYVNPIQFGPDEDLDRYPHDEAGDRAKCEAAGVAVLFMPTSAEMDPEKPSDFITVPGISAVAASSAPVIVTVS